MNPDYQFKTISIILAIALFVIILLFGIFTNVLKEGGKGMYSLSRFQLYLWTLIICPCFALRWGYHSTEFPTINETGLVLLGISAGTAVSSGMINTMMKIKGHPIKTDEVKCKYPFWMQLICDGNKNPSIQRLQQLIFTLVYVVIYLTLFFDKIPLEYADFNEKAYVLMGISQGAYVLGKTNEVKPIKKNTGNTDNGEQESISS